MSWNRKYDFQAGQRIASGQVDEELNQLIAAVNQIQTDDNSKDADVRSKAQMTKITTDTGAAKINISDTSGDILSSIVSAGTGLYTFYAVSDSNNLPANGTSGSIRGIAHMTSATFGWVYATDFKNNIYTNYMDSGVWRGWHRLVADDDTQSVLWTGIKYPAAADTITPSKKLSQCKNGWVLVWSDYDVGVGPNDSDFAFSYIPKGDPFLGKNHLFTISNNLSASALNVIVKKLLVSDASLVGYDENNVTATTTNDVVLRNVLEW